MRALGLLVKQEVGSRWKTIRELVQAWRATEIPKDKVLRQVLTTYIQREGLNHIALEILQHESRNHRPGPRAYAEQLQRLCLSMDSDDESRVPYASATHKYFEEIDRGRIPCGLPTIDQALGGGLGRGELGLVIAPAKRGKTSILVNFGAHAALLGKRVLHVTLEINRYRLLERFDMRISKSTSDELRKYPSRVKKARSITRKAKGTIVIQDLAREKVRPDRLQAIIEELMPLDLAIVDYPALMRDSEGRSALRDTAVLGEITEDIRRLTNVFDIPVWAASQVHRSAYDVDDFDMGNLAMDFSQAFTCDVAVCYMQTLDMKIRGTAKMKLDAQRSSASNPIVPVRLDLSRMFLEEIQIREEIQGGTTEAKQGAGSTRRKVRRVSLGNQGNYPRGIGR